MPLVLAGATSGQATLQATDAATVTLTLPASTGTLVVTGGAQTIEFADGSAAAPSITNSGDTNTGMFFPAADTIAFSEGGTEVARFDSAGNLGIGTTSPVSLLDVRNGTGSVVTLGKTSAFAGGQSSYIKWQEGSTQLVDIGWDANNNEVRINNRVAGFTSFYTSNAERMRIDSSGIVMVGTTSSSTGGVTCAQVLDARTRNSGFGLGVIGNASNTQIVRFAYDTTAVGSINITSNSTSYGTNSDYRLKENIAPMTGALDKVALLKPVTYKWKVDGSNGQGFIAHELQAIVPDCVTGEKDAMRIEHYEISPAIPATYDEEGNELTPAVEAVMGEREVPDYQGIDTSFLVATLTAAIQEQQAIITDLKARIETLENK